MAAPTFLDILRSEVARMQALHPDREGELARAHALILHGLVVPSPDDPAIGQVLSSDAQTVYRVNGTCDCSAGQHGKGCKHLQAWKLYQYVAGKVEAQPTPAVLTKCEDFTEAPVSITLKATYAGQDIMVTLRGQDFASVRAQVEEASAWLKLHAPAAGPTQGEGWCPVHQVAMPQTTKNGETWYSHKVGGKWCKGKGGR